MPYYLKNGWETTAENREMLVSRDGHVWIKVTYLRQLHLPLLIYEDVQVLFQKAHHMHESFSVCIWKSVSASRHELKGCKRSVYSFSLYKQDCALHGEEAGLQRRWEQAQQPSPCMYCFKSTGGACGPLTCHETTVRICPTSTVSGQGWWEL